MRTYETQSGTKVLLKDHSVDVGSVAPGVLDKVVQAARPSYAQRDVLESFVVTSAHDGTHSDDSLHDDGLAIDFRVWGFTDPQREAAATEIQRRLGKRWDVVDEVDHLHIEYDPA